jgi:exodeoxyribonuclease V alpha subunit
MMARSANEPSATVRGRVDALFYSSPQFSAGRLRTDSGDTVSFAGALMVRQHDPVVLHGTWERHPKFGRQFKVTHFAFDQRLGPEGLAHYLANHPDIKGIGPVKARRIVEAFGDDFDRVIDEEPERIAAVAKVPLDSVKMLRAEWLRTRTLNASLTWLASFELTHHQMTALIEKFGNAVVTVLKTDPYLLVREIPGFGFKRVDVVARKMGTPKEHPSRIRAGVVHSVAERLDQGDCWVDYEDLIELANALLVMDVADSREQIEQALDGLINDGALACVSLGGRFLVAQPHIHRMERDLAEVFTTRRRPNPHFAEADVEPAAAAAGAKLNEPQRRALLAAARHNLVLVSGGAGSGKTFTVAAITHLYEERGLKVALAAPTGKAAKRIEQVVGREALTLHRLLGFNGKAFTAGPEAPIQADVVIIDEVSMVDVPLAWQLFRALDLEKTCVVLVGDHNQLPPVGPGNLLRDLIERQPMPTVVLDQIVRQAGVLKENSIAVLSGDVRRTADAGSDGRPPWIVVNRLSDVLDAQRYVLELFDSVLVERLRFDLLADVQLLTPTRKGPLGVEALNIELQRLVQRKLWRVDVAPPRPGRRPEFLLHDRVIQTRNNYELEVMNGAIGIVTAVGAKRGELRVRFDDREIEFTAENEGAKDLSLAYALTIHKAQGSEFPCAVLIVHKAHSFMHHRNLFYTGVTRARQVAVVIGDLWGMRNCAEKEQVERRKTFLSVLDLPRADARAAGPW